LFAKLSKNRDSDSKTKSDLVANFHQLKDKEDVISMEMTADLGHDPSPRINIWKTTVDKICLQDI